MRLFKRGNKGFTLVEMLVVVAILGVLAAVAIPNVGKFIGKGKTEAQATEVADIRAAVIAMLADSTTKALTPVAIATNDMDTVVTTDTVPLLLSAYLAGLNADGTLKTTGTTYTFTADGTVTQVIAP